MNHLLVTKEYLSFLSVLPRCVAEREGVVVRLESYAQSNIKKRIRSIVTRAKWQEDRKKATGVCAILLGQFF